MIVRDRPGFLGLFLIFKGTVLERIWPQVLAVMLLSALVVWGHARLPGLVPSLTGAPFALLGIALSIFLSFRNGAGYDRWWEARKAWGTLVAAARDLDRQTLILTRRGPVAAAARVRLCHLAIVFADELVRHLRDGLPDATRPPLLDPADRAAIAASRNRPERVLRLMGETLADLAAAGTLSGTEVLALDGTLRDLTHALAACERLRSTPVPFGYTLLLHRTAYLFCFIMPFGFADVMGWATPFAAGLVAYTFFGLDTLSEELEEPFGTSPNDLPIQALARGIEITLRSALDEPDLPDPVRPVDHLLF